MMLKSCLLVAPILLVPFQAGAVTTFGDEAAFLASLASSTTEDFEDEALVGATRFGGERSLTFSDFSVRSSQRSLKILGDPFVGNHNTTPGGSQYLSSDTDIGFVSDFVEMSDFSSSFDSIGFNLIDHEKVGAVRINGFVYDVAPASDGVSTYWGITADAPITSIRIGNFGDDSHWSIDDVTFGTSAGVSEPIPEPTGALLFGVAMLIAGVATRRD